MKTFKFPAGEVHCTDNLDNDVLYIPYDRDKYSLNDWIMQIMLAGKPGREVFIPYLPYSRQDRPTSKGEPFSLKVFGDILNTAKFSKVYTLDVHSDVAFGCIDNLVNIPVEYSLKAHKIEEQDYTLVVPDQGAYKRLSKVFSMFSNVVTCIKERNTKTGYLELKHVIGDLNPRSNYMIVDDICDGGMTFILIANKLRELGVSGEIELAISHAILSKGVAPLHNAGIRKIYTTDSFGPAGRYHSCRSIFNDFKGSELL